MPRIRLASATLLALAVMLFPLACSDGPTGLTDDPAEMIMTASVVGTPISTLVVDITASDISTPIVYNLVVVNGVATGRLKMPPGEARVISVRAFDNTGEVTHEGSKTTDVRPGNGNPAVSIPMTARSGHVDITIQVGSVSIVLDPSSATLEENETVQLTATITAANGDELDVSPNWATTNPAFATVNEFGLVTGVLTGSASIVASYAGIAAVAPVNVTPGGQRQLTVSRAGTGSGTVTSNPAGINCGSDCTEFFAQGVPITLTASSASGSTFIGWSGGGCTGTGTCVVTLTGAASVTATFILAQHTLVVTRTGVGSGTVVSSPAGIACGTDCSETFLQGTTVTLNAVPNSGSAFAGWTGACTGTGACVVTMNAAANVSAAFSALSATLSGGWSCASLVSCQDVYDVVLPADTRLSIAVTSVTGSSVPRLAVFAPGQGLTGKNLLTGLARDRQCGGQNASDGALVKGQAAGTYRIAVGRDWGESAGASGTYVLTINADKPMSAPAVTVNDAASEMTAVQCGYSFTTTATWACASGVSCQDVYDLESLTPTSYTIVVNNITGNSVVRLAVFDGVSLSGPNRLNGLLADRRCFGQNAGDVVTTPTLATGLHRFAVGRDWPTSAGGSGSYTVTITTPNAPLIEGGATVNDGPSAFATTTCP